MRAEGKAVPEQFVQQMVPPPPPPTSQPQIDYSSIAPATFRQLVENRAAATGILFCPDGNKKYDGKQIYTFGDRSVYFEETLICTYNPERKKWQPIGLEGLLATQET